MPADVIQNAARTAAAPSEGNEWSVGHFEIQASCAGYTIQYKGGPEYLIVPHTWTEELPELVQDILTLLNRKN